jgi:hypothetical protein
VLEKKEKVLTRRAKLAGPFGMLRAGSSTTPLAIKLQEAPLRMTLFLYQSAISLNLYGRYCLGNPKHDRRRVR